jgi:hypothetical protein
MDTVLTSATRANLVQAFLGNGGGGSGIASLSGPGLTASPGALNQNGNLTISGSLDVATHNDINISSTDGIIKIQSSQGPVFIDSYYSGIGLYGNISAIIKSDNQVIVGTNNAYIALNENNGSGSGSIDVGPNASSIGFLGATPVAKQVSGGTISGVIQGLINLGLFSS